MIKRNLPSVILGWLTAGYFLLNRPFQYMYRYHRKVKFIETVHLLIWVLWNCKIYESYRSAQNFLLSVSSQKPCFLAEARKAVKSATFSIDSKLDGIVRRGDSSFIVNQQRSVVLVLDLGRLRKPISFHLRPKINFPKINFSQIEIAFRVCPFFWMLLDRIKLSGCWMDVEQFGLNPGKK